MAVAYVKLTMAVVLVAGPSMWWAAAAAGVAWFAVDVHMSTILLAGPVMAAFVWRELAAKRWMRGLETARALAEIVVLFEVPYIVDQMLRPAEELRPVELAGHMGNVHPLTGLSLAMQYFAGFMTLPGSTLVYIVVAALLMPAPFTVPRGIPPPPPRLLPLAPSS